MATYKSSHTGGQVDTAVNQVLNNNCKLQWGNAIGTLANQTDLQDALSSKQDISTAVTHTASTAAGSTTQPVYVDASGVATAITSYEGNAATATKATQDASGNVITTTYATKTELSTKQDSLTAGSAMSLDNNIASVKIFDKSNFTIGGTPVITDDGVVSGLSSSNYITAISPDLWTNWDNWHIHFRVYCDFSYTSYCYLGDFTYGYLQYNPGYHALVLQVYDTSNAQIWIAIENFNSKVSTGYIDVDIYYSSETGYYFTATQGTKTYTSSKSSNKNKLRYATNKLIKFNSSSAPVNLKQFSVTVDGEEVISGSKTIYEVPHIISTYVSGTSGYNIWSNGYCEQWGYYTISSANTWETISLAKTYIDTNYSVVTSIVGASQYVTPIKVGNSSINTVNTLYATTTGTGIQFNWKTSGYLASGQY